ncbi:hypothetical protein JN11_02900 [Mucilaginibacter frigoritolerans]|uniref:O-antigen ligase-like membrane protein n=1 Tax=Mucilaginibacter frigoritolerans TaxID=652788 RepID=A0A562TYN7_9SPHI|nr:hypothetical protein [Mucilaginibacter frigoritolerans]TWI98712.1 hypothetical protein JN11_02900 [Mucilaginibacter frigoritolerans]
MITSIAGFNLKKLLNKVDWKLLLFLMLFLNVKLVVKIPAIIIIYLLQFNFRFGFSFKNSRLPLFYVLIVVLAFFGLLINGSYHQPHYIAVFLTGIGFWLLCLLAVHQIKLSVERNDVETLHSTVLVFFVINAVVSFYNIGIIIHEIGTINPYRYQGEYQKYFISTGDYIKGLTFDISTTNAVINAFGVIYFLSRKNAVMVLACMAVLLLTGSNFVNLALLSILGFLFIFKSTRDQKSLIVICLMFLVIFLVQVSPQNNKYVGETFKDIIHPPRPPFASRVIALKKDSIPTPEDIKRKFAQNYLDSIKAIRNKAAINKHTYPELPGVIKTEQGRILIPVADINTRPYQTPTDTSNEQRLLLAFIDNHKTVLALSGRDTFQPGGLPGKAISLLQTVKFLQHHPAKIIAGDGMGNFSSKLAFKATGLGFNGGYPAKYAYINNDFLLNHLDVYLNFFSKASGLHSLTNSPYSVYDQLLAEYGLAGLLVFVIFYLGFFAKHYKKLTYGIPLLMLLLAVLFIDYWFEQLSVIVFFELLLLLNIKETTKPATINYALQ